jgi:hypothetical protein
MKKLVKKQAPDSLDINGTRGGSTIQMGQCRIGIAKGATINVGNFQSARNDVWMEKVTEDNEHDINSAVVEIAELLDEILQEESDKLGEE